MVETVGSVDGMSTAYVLPRPHAPGEQYHPDQQNTLKSHGAHYSKSGASVGLAGIADNPGTMESGCVEQATLRFPIDTGDRLPSRNAQCRPLLPTPLSPVQPLRLGQRQAWATSAK